MRLKDIFIEFLKSKNINCISTNSKKALKDDPIQYIARNFASGNFEICCGRGRYAFNLEGEKIDECDFLAWKCRGINRKEIEDKLKSFPYIVIDCSLKHLHSEKELKSLVKQLEKTLSVVRRYMWDERLVIASIETRTSAMHCKSVEEFLEKKRPKRVILLDPNSDEEFKGDKADCYIVGGIVDKAGNKAGATAMIYERLIDKGFKVERRKILLRGDVIGVPDRINLITEVLLKVILDGEEIEKAIYDVQNRKIARWRLRKEIAKNCLRIVINGRKFRVIKKSFFKEVSKWLKVNEEDFYRCSREMGVIVVSDAFLNYQIKRSKVVAH